MKEETKGEMKSDLYYLAEAIASIKFLDALLEGQSWQFPDGIVLTKEDWKEARRQFLNGTVSVRTKLAAELLMSTDALHEPIAPGKVVSAGIRRKQLRR